MIHVILLDIYQSQVADDEYAVTYSGSLADCKARKTHDGEFATWEKSDFQERGKPIPTTLTGPTGSKDTGRIVALVSAAKAKHLMFGAAAGLAIGVAVGVLAGKIGGDSK